MESPIPLYPTDCPPPYEAVMGQRAVSQVSVFPCTCVHQFCEYVLHEYIFIIHFICFC